MSRIVIGTVNVCESYGSEDQYLIGVFDDMDSEIQAIAKFERKFYGYRTFVKSHDTATNSPHVIKL